MAESTSLQQLLEREYPFNVFADPDGGYVIAFPDLPGCMTQIDSLSELPEMVEDVRRLWIETAFEDGALIPEPTYRESYSGRFNVRLPRSLHRRLAERASDEGVSLNQLVVALLAGGIERPEITAAEPTTEPRRLAAVG